MEKFINFLKDNNVCVEASDWVVSQSCPLSAWENCSRSDWLIWLAGRLDTDARLLVLAAVHCAGAVRHLMRDERSLRALDVVIAYCNGTATAEDLTIVVAEAEEAAGYGAAMYYVAKASDIAASAAAKSAHYAAKSAHYAAKASDIAVVADHAAAVADHAAAAEDYAAAAEARVANLMEMADICREYLTAEVINKAEEKGLL